MEILRGLGKFIDKKRTSQKNEALFAQILNKWCFLHVGTRGDGSCEQ